jgi:predicted DNA-binding protein YlxM (UPF0122 family)
LASLELRFEFEESKKALNDGFKDTESRLEEEINLLKMQMVDKEIDQNRFTEMNKAINDRLDINKEIEDIKESW